MGIFQNNLMGAAAAAASAGGGDFYDYQIANSCRFDRPNASKLSRALGTATANTKWTFSTWVKFSSFPTGTTDDRCLFGATGSTYSLGLGLTSSTSNEPQLLFIDYPSSAAGPNAGGIQTLVYLKRLSRDPSAWYHIVVNQDTTQSTASDRIKFYINGELQTDFDDHTSGGSATPFYPSQNSATINDSIHTLLVGVDNGDNAANTLDGYMAETYFIDGTAYAGSDFGETKNGVWIPKDASGLTFGNNGFYLKYESSSDLGNDSSGNNNDYTVSNISAHDQMLDSPTFNSNSNGGNFPTYNPLLKAPTGLALSEGNLKATLTVDDNGIMTNWQVPVTGKWYWEIDVDSIAGSHGVYIGVMPANTDLTINQESNNLGLVYYSINGNSILKGTRSSYGATYTTGDIISIAVDRDADTIQFYKNGSGQGTIDISSLDEEFFCYMGYTGGSGPCSTILNFGQDGTFAGNVTAGGNSDGTGYGNFKYSVPSGFLALCSGNQPVADAVDPAQTDDNYPQKLFGAKLYTGNGGTNAITGLGFQPDVVWGKSRSNAQDHFLADSTNGTGKDVIPNSNVVQQTENGVTSFDTDGWTMGSIYNANAYTYVGWTWRANGGSTSSGSGDLTSTHQVDPSGGFSIVKAVGDGGSGDKTVTHGMSAAPDCILAKDLDLTRNWDTYFSEGVTAGSGMRLNTDEAPFTGRWGTVNSSIFTCKDSYTWGGTDNYIYYCFRNIEGYIKVGTYVGNANVDGTFVYTGFKPAFFMCKPIVAGNWRIQDTARSSFNVANKTLFPNLSNAEESNDSNRIDILSNGVKMRASDSNYNQATTFVYLAMAENPFKYATAR